MINSIYNNHLLSSSFCPSTAITAQHTTCPLYASPDLEENPPETGNLQSFSPQSGLGQWKIEIPSLDISQPVAPNFLSELQAKNLKDRDLRNFAKLCVHYKQKPSFIRLLQQYFKEATLKDPSIQGNDLLQAMRRLYQHDRNFKTFKKNRAVALEYGQRLQNQATMETSCPVKSRISTLMNSLSDCLYRTVNSAGKKITKLTVFLTGTKDDATHGLRDLGAPDNLVSKGEYNLFKRLEATSNFCHKFVSTTGEVMDAIEEFAEHSHDYESSTLILNAHGEARGMMLSNRINMLTTGMLNPRDPLTQSLKKISRTSKIVLIACDAAKGKATSPNLANSIANACHKDVEVVAPFTRINAVIYKNDQWELLDHRGNSLYDLTYSTSPSTKKEKDALCSKDKISFLNACNKNGVPLFKLSYLGNDDGFYNGKTKSFDKVTDLEKIIETLTPYKISNRHLVQVSSAGMPLGEFARRVLEKSKSMSADRITKQILSEYEETED